MNRWTARLLAVCAGVLSAAGSLAAQNTGTITGQVIMAETRTPVSSAQVFLVGTNVGSLTNAEGRFTLVNVPAGPRTLRVQMMGYGADDQTVTVVAGASVNVRFELKQQAIALSGVVVTALGIQRSEKSLGYAVQTVSSQAIERSPEVTLVNALAGQSAGVQVTSSGSQPGASARIVIRGESSFQGDGQPLFVIDGVPINMNLDSKGGNPLETGEMGSRGMDIDPNNIEEISILRGAAATVLYGSRAAFGAVVIRTKQGTPGAKARMLVSSRFGSDVPILSGVQELYAGGRDGYFCNGKLREQGGWCQPGHPLNNPNPTSNDSWGPHRDSIPQIVLDSVGPVRFRDARKDFYDVGRTIENSFTITGSLPAATYNFGISQVDQSGIFPGSKLDRLNINANVGANLTSSLRSTTTVNFSNSDNITSNEGYSSLTRTIYQMPLTRDISQAWMPDGSPVMFASNTPHPEWLSLNEYNKSSTARWIASQFLELTLVPGLKLTNRIGLDTYVDERNFFANERPWRTVAGQTSGGTDQEKISRTQINNDMVLSLERYEFGGGIVNLSGLMGANVNMQENSNIRASGDNILVPGNYGVGNFTTDDVSGNLEQKRRLVGLYGQVTADYKNVAFLTLTGRNDWSSTLPENNNSYFYPSASLAFVFTDAFNLGGRILDYGKVRVSLTKVGSDAPPYRLDTRYNVAGGGAASNAQQQNPCCGLSFPIPQQNGVPGYVQSQQLGNPDLKPETTVEGEVGLELRMFSNRLRTNFSYYNKKSYDQIFNVPSSATTGYTSITRNAGDLQNRGVEISVFTSPIQMRDFNWDVQLNFSRNRSAVLSLAPGVTSLYLAGYAWPQIRIMEGYEYGVIWGYGFLRNEQGQMLIGDDGYPILDDQLKVLGETQQDWLGSVNTTIRFKNFMLSGLLDTKQGGQLLNFDQQYNVPLGKPKMTEQRGDYYVFPGVNVNTGEANDVQLLRDRTFYNRFAGFDVHENQIEDASAVRLREMTLQYSLPRVLLDRLHAQSAAVYVTGRNLKVWTPTSRGDPDGSNYGSANAGGAYYQFFTAPPTRSWILGMRASF
jgi:TonB-linked SusC/RagA family outer membrane protein